MLFLYSLYFVQPLDANSISSDTASHNSEKSERDILQGLLLNAATTNALVMSLEGLLREHGHRMSGMIYQRIDIRGMN